MARKSRKNMMLQENTALPDKEKNGTMSRKSTS